MAEIKEIKGHPGLFLEVPPTLRLSESFCDNRMVHFSSFDVKVPEGYVLDRCHLTFDTEKKVFVVSFLPKNHDWAFLFGGCNDENDRQRMADLLHHNYMLALQNGIFKLRLKGENPEYRYWDGSAMIAVDPLKIYGELYDKGDRSIYSVAKSQSRDAEKSAEKIRKVFRLNGLSQAETIKLANHFMEYCDSLRYAYHQDHAT